MSVSILVGLAVSNQTICNDPIYGTTKNNHRMYHRSNFMSKINKDDAKGLGSLLENAYPPILNQENEYSDRAIQAQINDLSALAQLRQRNLNAKKDSLKEVPISPWGHKLKINPKNIKKGVYNALLGVSSFTLASYLAQNSPPAFDYEHYAPEMNPLFQINATAILLAGLYGTCKVYGASKKLWKGLVRPEAHINNKIRCNQEITEAIDSKRKRLELSKPE